MPFPVSFVQATNRYKEAMNDRIDTIPRIPNLAERQPYLAVPCGGNYGNFSFDGIVDTIDRQSEGAFVSIILSTETSTKLEPHCSSCRFMVSPASEGEAIVSILAFVSTDGLASKTIDGRPLLSGLC